MLDDEVTEAISGLVRSGFYEKQRMLEILCEELYAPGELDSNEVASHIDSAIAALQAEKKTWPEVTDCDRLDKAFLAINARGVVAIQNAGYTQSDGYEDCMEAYRSHPDKAGVIGYCFYHGQDLERAVAGQGLFFGFGPVDPDLEQTVGVEVGQIICEELGRVGFEVDWSGTFDKRPSITKLVWLRR